MEYFCWRSHGSYDEYASVTAPDILGTLRTLNSILNYLRCMEVIVMLSVNKNIHEAPHDRPILVWVKKTPSEFIRDEGWFMAFWSEDYLTWLRKDRVWVTGPFEDDSEVKVLRDSDIAGWCDVLPFLPALNQE